MFKLTRPLRVLLTALILAAALSACGSDKQHGIPSDAVAVVGDTPITRATLNHWMSSITGGDFYEHVGKRAPRGLVAEPPNYPSCIAAAKTLSAGGKPGAELTSARLTSKCHELYAAVKEQALSFLISVQWRINEAAEHGLTVSDADVNKYFQQLSAKQFPKPGEFATYLANHGWVLSDELHQLKRNLLTTKLHEKVAHGGKGPRAQLAFISLVKSNIKKRTAETNCRPGYVAFQCRQYRASSAATQAPSLLLEEFVTKQ